MCNCPLHGGRQRRGRDERLGEALLILGRNLDERAFLDGLARGFLRGGDDGSPYPSISLPSRNTIADGSRVRPKLILPV